ncbi:hypothetical protein [Cellulomonas sp. FA1]|uniref:hypothetical protein n=1 Tax=Cellulomonas sp. FA1 TaxID=1346710 RepID=UPI00128B6450|nr:hypothetical protein [Cellulomonas sp. FA1]
MIALCSEHAGKADGNYYPDEYLDRLKSEGRGRSEAVQGTFDYLRLDMIAKIGSNVYYDVDTLVEINGEPAVYFGRDAAGYLLLNINLPAPEGGSRARLENNVWTVDPGAERIDCPPRGRHIRVDFEDGDGFYVGFTEYPNAATYSAKNPSGRTLIDSLSFPVVVAEFWERSGSHLIEFGRNTTRFPSSRGSIAGSLFIGGPVGISYNSPPSPALLSSLNRALEDFNGRSSSL